MWGFFGGYTVAVGPEPSLLPQDVPHEVMSTIMDEYQGSRSHAHAKREAFQELLSDIILNFPILNFSRNLRGEPIPAHLSHPSHFGPGAELL